MYNIYIYRENIFELKYIHNYIIRTLNKFH